MMFHVKLICIFNVHVNGNALFIPIEMLCVLQERTDHRSPLHEAVLLLSAPKLCTLHILELCVN